MSEACLYGETEMSWLKPPLRNADRHFDKAWGLHFMLDSDDPRDKSKPIFGVPDEVLDQKLPRKLMDKLFGPNRHLFAICNNGTTAVTIAISNSATPSHVQLAAMGSYTGAYSFTEKFSSVPVDIDDFYKRESLALERIVPLPYLQRKEIGTTSGNRFEDDCLRSLMDRALGFAMRGTPVGSLCLELVLSGNGLQLSRRFCEKLRTFCTRTGIAIIADEILTGFRCTAEPTVLLSDTLNLNPDFIVLAKFIGCGLVLQDKSMSTTKFSGRQRRWPTTTCPMVTVDHLSMVLHKFLGLVHKNSGVFDQVGNVVEELFPETSEGRGLIWFIEDNRTPAVPAPFGVQRLLFKLMPTSVPRLAALKQRLLNLPKTRRSKRQPGQLGLHIQQFRSVSCEFIHNWPTGHSTLFENSAPYCFGLAYALRYVAAFKYHFRRKSGLYAFMMGLVKGMSKSDVKQIINGVKNNCGESLLFVSTTNDRRGKQHKVIKFTEFTLRFVGERKKRNRSRSSTSSGSSSSDSSHEDAVNPVPPSVPPAKVGDRSPAPSPAAHDDSSPASAVERNRESSLVSQVTDSDDDEGVGTASSATPGASANPYISSSSASRLSSSASVSNPTAASSSTPTVGRSKGTWQRPIYPSDDDS